MEPTLTQSLLTIFIMLIGLSIMIGGANGPRFLLRLLLMPFIAVLPYVLGGIIVVFVLAMLLYPRLNAANPSETVAPEVDTKEKRRQAEPAPSPNKSPRPLVALAANQQTVARTSTPNG